MPFDTNIIIYVLAGVLFLALVWVIRLEIRLNRVLRGKNGKTLEDTISNSYKQIQDLNNFKKESSDYFKNVENRLKQSIQYVETIRFNPFKGTGQGGGQSFVTAFINEKGDGVVLSSLYSRERVSVFAKPVKNLNSDFELTDEEKEVLNKTKKK